MLGVAAETVSRWEGRKLELPPLAAFALGELYERPEIVRETLEALEKRCAAKAIRVEQSARGAARDTRGHRCCDQLRSQRAHGRAKGDAPHVLPHGLSDQRLEHAGIGLDLERGALHVELPAALTAELRATG